MVGKIVLYFIFACIVFMGTKSCTDNWLPPDSSAFTAGIFASIGFVVLLVLSLTIGIKKDNKGKK